MDSLQSIVGLILDRFWEYFGSSSKRFGAFPIDFRSFFHHIFDQRRLKELGLDGAFGPLVAPEEIYKYTADSQELRRILEKAHDLIKESETGDRET